MFSFMVSFKGVFLEGMEVVFIVITFGLNANNVPARGHRRGGRRDRRPAHRDGHEAPLSMINENLLKYGVGLLLATFGTYWAVEGMGIFRDGGESVKWPGSTSRSWPDRRVVPAQPSVHRGTAVARPRRGPAQGRGRPVRFLKSFGQFWYDFIIGDDWKIAVAVVIALGVVLIELTLGVFGDTGLALSGGLAIVIAFAISLALDVRRKKGS